MLQIHCEAVKCLDEWHLDDAHEVTALDPVVFMRQLVQDQRNLEVCVRLRKHVWRQLEFEPRSVQEATLDLNLGDDVFAEEVDGNSLRTTSI
jgi:hypothetical protein